MDITFGVLCPEISGIRVIYPQTTCHVDIKIIDPPDLFTVCIRDLSNTYPDMLHLLDINCSVSECSKSWTCIPYNQHMKRGHIYQANILAQSYMLSPIPVPSVGFSLPLFIERYHMVCIDSVEIRPYRQPVVSVETVLVDSTSEDTKIIPDLEYASPTDAWS